MSHHTPDDPLQARMSALFGHVIEDARARHHSPLAMDVRKMSALFTADRKSRRGGYMNEAALRRAYLGYFAPLNAVKTALALRRLQAEGVLALEGPVRVADLGAGPLSSLLGCWLAGLELESALAVDRSMAVLEEGRQVLEAVAPEVAPRVELRQGAVDRPLRGEGARYDLVVLANVLNELGDPRRDLGRRIAAVKAALARVSEGGALLVLEPATRVHGRALQAVRDALVESGLEVSAPCMGARRCPLLDTRGSWCFSEYPFEPPKVAARLAKEAGLHLSPLKAATLVVRPGAAAPSGLVRVVSGVMREGRVERRYLCTDRGLSTARGRPELPTALSKAVRGEAAERPEERWLESAPRGGRRPRR